MPSKAGRRLPPEPPRGTSDAPPPPLPSRPNSKLPPRPGNNTKLDEPDEYLEPADWTEDDAPALPPRNFSPSPEDGETYEVPDLPPPPSRGNQAPPRSRGKPPPPASPPSSDSESDIDGELYDELEGIAPDQQKPKLPPPPQANLPPPPQDFEGEIYDQCDIKEQDETIDGELYEDPNENPPPDVGGGEIYEVPDEASLPKPTNQRRDVPLPPPPVTPQPPSTNTMPAPVPSRAVTTGQNTHKVLKKMSGEGATGIGISLDMLGDTRARLKKVSSEREPDKTSLSDTSSETGDGSSVKDKISLFKAAETGPRPSMTVKPSVHSHALSSRNLPPPPPPPIYSLGFTAPGHLQGVNKPTQSQKPQPEAKSPPPPQVTSAPPPSRTVQPSPPPYQEEIYDDAINVIPQDPLSGEVWYHGERDRKDCDTDITKKGQDGTYLVRKSAKGGDSQPYTLVVFYKGHVYNLKIRRRQDNKIALGNEKKEELAFDSVPELISHHTTNEVILINQREDKQYRAFLKTPLRVT